MAEFKKFRFHALGIPHTVTSKEYLSCAYTQKVLKFCKMMYDMGHEVYHYGHEDSDVVCTEHITVTTNETLEKAYGGYDWKKQFFKHNTTDYAHTTFNKNTIKEGKNRIKDGDFILCFWGFGHQPIADAYPNAIAVEPGIGYTSGSFCNFRVFESYAVANVSYGTKTPQPGWYDAVIPNYFEVDDFEFKDKHEKEDYYLYLGRITHEKGVTIAIDVANKMGKKLKIAGQGDLKENVGYKGPMDNIELVGFADVEKRKELMANAKLVLMPTYYNEPFGGVMVEALLSGTPVITTDWGAFTENNLHGYTGYRCRNMDQFIWAAKNIDKIDNKFCRNWAVNNFSLEKVSQMYQEYFHNLHNIYNGNGGFPYVDENRKELDWMKKDYPFNYE